MFLIDGILTSEVNWLLNLDDLLQCLDALDQIPPIFCEALDLLKLPPLALDPMAEQVKLFG